MTYYIMPEYAPSKNGMYIFAKKAEIKEECTGTLNIFAASRYILYINGQYVCEGPCRSNEKIRYYDSVECKFKKGTNFIEVRVMHTMDYFATVYKTVVPMLVMEAVAGEDTIITDSSWECRYLGEYEFTRFGLRSLPPFEIVTKGKDDIILPVEQGDRCVFKENGHFISGGAALSFLLEKRPIPMIYPGEEFELKLIKSGDGFAEYDAGQYVTAKVKFDIAKNSDVKIIYSECYEFEDGKRRRDDSSGFLTGYYDKVKTSLEDFCYEPFWFRPFRYIRIEGGGVSTIKARRVNYPFYTKGDFVCSDENYNRMYEVSKNTLLCCCHEIISDCPYYEQQQYQFDSSVQLAAISCITDDTRLAKKCIGEFAVSQMPNGLLLSIYPSSWAVQIIPGYSLLWIMMIRTYLDNTADTEFVSRYVGNIDAILGFFQAIFDQKGFITPTRYWDFIDWVPGWENHGGGAIPLNDDEAHTLYNMYYACALKDAAYICDKLGRDALAKQYRSSAGRVIQMLNSLCYDAQKGMYKDGSLTQTYSMHTIAWAILSETVTGQEAKKLISNFNRTDISKCTFAMNYYLFRALEKCGCYDMAFDLFGDWQTMLDNGCTTWCENPDNPRSECHGWSCAPLYEFASNILGVKHSISDEIVIKPIPGKLTHAGGTVPGRYGEVYVNWSVEDGNFRIEIAAPEDVKKRVIMPDGGEHVFADGKCVLVCSVEV